MEGKYTKASALLGTIGLVITIWQIYPKSKKDYSGKWNMVSEIEEAQMKDYRGMRIEWVLHLIQSGDQITGTAEKISVNSKKLDYKSRTSLNLNGSINDDKFVLNFIEKGKFRETHGLFTGVFINDNFLGDFSSTASDSKGKITGEKIK